jgi:opacity protein-like surface antigen
VDGGWFNDVATQQQQDLAAPLLSYLKTTTGKVAASSVKRPAIDVTVGARRVFEGVRLPASLRPYAQAGVGFAQIKRKPTLTLDGTDVTSTLQSYGVVLGEDMAGTEHRAAATVGFGVLRPIRKMYIDVAYRLTYIPTSGSSTKVNGVRIGVGARF